MATGPGPVAPQGTPPIVPPRELTVVNHYRVPATKIFVWPSTTEALGDNRVPTGLVVPPGYELKRIPLPEGADCLWKVGAIFDNKAEQIVPVDLCKESTVTLTGPKPGTPLGTGTGFYISTSGHVLTNHHVVYGCASVTIDRGGAGDLPLQVIGQDPVSDLAILQESGVVTSPWHSARSTKGCARATE